MKTLVTHPTKGSFDIGNVHFEKGQAILDDQGTSHLMHGQQHEDLIKVLTDLGCTFKDLDKKPAKIPDAMVEKVGNVKEAGLAEPVVAKTPAPNKGKGKK